MKKTYTKKQIAEAIAYWKKQLKKMDEAQTSSRMYWVDDYIYKNMFNDPTFKNWKAALLSEKVWDRVADIAQDNGIKYLGKAEMNIADIEYKGTIVVVSGEELVEDDLDGNFKRSLLKLGLDYDFDETTEVDAVGSTVTMHGRMQIIVVDEDKFLSTFA